jgi:hypothetical protein
MADCRSRRSQARLGFPCWLFTWPQLAGMLRRTAEGKEDVAEVSTALQIVFQIEGIEYRQSE